jgi:hypothetical protein
MHIFSQKAGSRNKRAANSTEPRESLADPVRLVRKVHVVTDDDLALIEQSALGSTIVNVAPGKQIFSLILIKKLKF